MEIKLDNNCMIGDGHPCFIIAEAGVNHNGELDKALQLVDAAADSGADAVKFQTFKTESIITKIAPKAKYHVETTGDDSKQTWFDLLKSQELTEEMHVALIDRCKQRDILFLSTPYDNESVDLLARLNVALYKIASTDANNIFFLEYIASKGRPVILSTAMCNFDEVERSISAIQKINNDLIVLQCTGNYPASIEQANLKSMIKMKESFNVLAGYSDHVMGSTAAISAIALGACVYEKHFTLDRLLPGPDHRASMEPKELSELIIQLRNSEKALGDGNKRVMDCEKANRSKLRKNILACHKIKKGTVLCEVDLVIKRAGGVGLSADCYHDIIGRKTRFEINADEPITYKVLE
jgi:N-acetylneuraminate synthase/N,N'-diacetyllegionaminate synthase